MTKPIARRLVIASVVVFGILSGCAMSCNGDRVPLHTPEQARTAGELAWNDASPVTRSYLRLAQIGSDPNTTQMTYAQGQTIINEITKVGQQLDALGYMIANVRWAAGRMVNLLVCCVVLLGIARWE